MICTLIIPCHNEEENIDTLYEAIIQVVGTSTGYEFLFVDDGSDDGTLAQIRALRARDSRVGFVSFLRNYGHQKALLAGLRACKEGIAISLDADLQHHPKYIPVFLEEYARSQADVVVGKRATQQVGFCKNLFSKTFYAIFPWLTGIDLIPDTSDYRLYSRMTIDILSSIKEPEPFLRALVGRLKFTVAVVEYDLEPRKKGVPSYTFKKSLSMALNGLFLFSSLPYRVGLSIGCAGATLSFVQAIHYAYLRLFTDRLVPGQADQMVLLGLSTSFILIILSLLFKLVDQIRSCLVGIPPYIIVQTERGSQTCNGKPDS